MSKLLARESAGTSHAIVEASKDNWVHTRERNMIAFMHRSTTMPIVATILRAVLLFLASGCTQDDSGVARLVRAIRNDDAALAKQLINDGFGLHRYEYPDRVTWEYPVHVAASYQNLTILHLLVKAGADPNQADHLGKTPVMRVVGGIRHGTGIECLEFLCAAGGDVNSRASGQYGNTAAHLAARFGLPEYVEVLADHGAEFNVKLHPCTEGGNTPLHEVCTVLAHGRCADTVRVLIENGADPTIRNDEGLTPLQLAVKNDRDEIAALLRKVESAK